MSSFSPAVSAGEHRYFLYTPELHLMAETELTSAPHPVIDNEYIWFDGMPVAQQSSTGETRWTFTDHLGTPILQTSSLQGIVWRAEYEPYGRIFELRAQDVHQPLRLPGQEAEQLNAGANGATDRSYNVHRWYSSGLTRYVQADPTGLLYGSNLFSYSGENPGTRIDPLGLYASWVHGDITREAVMGTCLGRIADYLAERVEAVDSLPHSQDPDASHAHWHSMRAPGQSIPDAIRKTRHAVHQELQSCSLRKLAFALHAIEDGFAAGHRGFQIWRGTPSWTFWNNQGEGYWDTIKHVWGDAFLPGAPPTAPVLPVTDAVADWCARCKCRWDGFLRN